MGKKRLRRVTNEGEAALLREKKLVLAYVCGPMYREKESTPPVYIATYLINSSEISIELDCTLTYLAFIFLSPSLSDSMR